MRYAKSELIGLQAPAAAIFFVEALHSRLSAEIEHGGRVLRGEAQQTASYAAALIFRPHEQLGDGVEEIPLVDKGNYGFHCPCPHRTLLWPLFSDPVYSRCARIHGDPHALLRGVLGVPTNSSQRNWWGELQARASFY